MEIKKEAVVMTADWGSKNRRRFPRINYPCLVVLVSQEQNKETILSHTENIGTGGACVILKRSIKPFCPVEIELDLLDFGNHVKCSGRVVWCVKRPNPSSKKEAMYDVGIEFVDIKDKEKKRLKELLYKAVNSTKITK